MAAEGGAIVTFIFNGENREDIPRNVTHLIIHESITVIHAYLLYKHPNLVEVYCHAGVTRIEKWAFYCCLSLQRVIIPGVIIIEEYAFYECGNLIHVECGKLERFGVRAFSSCDSLSSINLPSAKIVGKIAFCECPAMTQAIFGKDLESIGRGAFSDCSSLESITIPCKNSLFTEDNIFTGCVNLKRVDLIEDEFLRDIADALLRDDWRNDMNEVLDSINEVLPRAKAHYVSVIDPGGKAIAIRDWIESVLRKVTHYKAAHRELLNEAAAVLQLSLPNDSVMNNVLPFLEMPAHSFDWEDEAE